MGRAIREWRRSSFAKFNNSFRFDRRLLRPTFAPASRTATVWWLPGVESCEEQRNQRGAETILARGRATPGTLMNWSRKTFILSSRLAWWRLPETRAASCTPAGSQRSVATDLKLWLREAIDDLNSQVIKTQTALLDLAENNVAAVLPGYTHLQRAQPILLAHWCLAYFEMLARDRERLGETRQRVNVLPLGAAALDGTSFPIDREAVARELGFDSVTRNSIDAVSDRDFCVEFVSACSLIMVHLSRLAEEVILYSTSEFGFFELSDAVATGSSLMPQKKNPDSMELVRGKAGRVFGHNVSLLTMLKGLPLAYNKDMQEDKEAIFDAFDTTLTCLEVSALVLGNVNLNDERMRAAASRGQMNATELADYLVRKGVAFRDAHEIVGRIVVKAIESSVELGELSLNDLRSFSNAIEDDVFASLTLEQTLGSKSVFGGTAPQRVIEAVAAARRSLIS